ncbi:MAG: hypothetical protein JXC32_01500 [Anaerolineae bacterium]|nr:hypothetical protein [Anaerolineae bacterium]
MILRHSIANPLTTIRTKRSLPRPGELLVRTGDGVEPSQVVAEATIPPDFRIVDFAKALDVPPRNAKSYLKVKRGQAIAEGEVLASRGGLGARACRSPIGGTVVGVGRGRLLLQAEPEVVRRLALVPGFVVEMHPGEAVVIETVGGFIQALWGNGYEAHGVLRLLVRDAQHPIRATHINASSQGAILIGGATVEEEAIEPAIDMQVRGMIVGSIPAHLMPRLKQAGFPILATEGIGETPMTQTVFNLLRSLDGREASISGEIGDRWHPQRPYIVVPMPTQAAQAIKSDTPLRAGDRVRVLRGTHRGRSGTIHQLLTTRVQLETGARLPGALVDIGEEEPIGVPYANLERLL